MEEFTINEIKEITAALGVALTQLEATVDEVENQPPAYTVEPSLHERPHKS